MPASVRRRIAVLIAAVAGLVVVPGVARAEPPSNDDFDASMVVTALPFEVRLDTSGATGASDDPFWCQGFPYGGTVWFSYTATTDILLRATTVGSDHGTILSAHTGDRGDLFEVPGACDVEASSGAIVTVPARAGTTYHFMVAGYGVQGGALSFGLRTVSPAPNDDFADAEPISTLPSTRESDLAVASAEPDEPPESPRCAGTVNRSVWYAFTPAETTSVVVRVGAFETVVSVYTGSTPSELREIACRAAGSPEIAPFRVTAGVTYHLRVGGSYRADQVALSVMEAPPLQPRFSFSPSAPTIYEETRFAVDSGEFGTPIASGEWDFGDGTSAPATESLMPHHYAADGTYEVRLSLTSADGRSGTFSAPVTVATHDVSITRFSVPAKARTGETKPIAVHVANTRYRETVTTELYKSEGQSWQLVGTLTLDVPARPDRTVRFPFAYTFTAADALVGKVTFRAVIRLPSEVRDARPMDNEVIAISTTVYPSLTDLRHP